MINWVQGRSYRQCHRCVAPGPPSPNKFQGAPDRRTSNIFFLITRYHTFMNFRLRFCIETNRSSIIHACRLQQIEPDRSQSYITIIKRFIRKIIKANLKIAFACSLFRGPQAKCCTGAPKSLATALKLTIVPTPWNDTIPIYRLWKQPVFILTR